MVSYFFIVDSGAAIVLSAIVPVLSDIVEVVVVVVVSSAFLPQLTTARATVDASTATIASAKSLRILIKFTSLQSRRAGRDPAAANRFAIL